MRVDEQHTQRQRAEWLGAAMRPEKCGCCSMCGRTVMPSGMVAKTDGSSAVSGLVGTKVAGRGRCARTDAEEVPVGENRSIARW